MVFAVDQAKRGTAGKGNQGQAAFAVLLTIATQRHNNEAVGVLTTAGYEIAKYLATK
jgi:hypothetical protein